jgi:ATP-dependent RNA helicase RhlE
MSFADLGLSPELLRAVSEKGYDTPTPIQSQAIPAVLSGRDVLAGAQTGTGKTAAFVLPILQKLGGPSSQRAPRAVVLTPTRELAAQIAENARTYGKYVGVRTVVVFGGVGINPQIDALRNGCDLLIATPGRLLDLQEQGSLDLRSVQYFVLDEADRMLDMGFIHQIKRVFKLLPPVRQNLMFSATYSDDIRELASRILRNPVSAEVAARNATADRVDQQVYRVSKDHKRHLLAHLIDEGNWHQVLVFTRTKHGANRLAQQLEGSGIRSAAIHGNKSQSARVRALADFKANKVTALVATEVAARGLDIKELPQVVNYELPNVPEDYVHRIGRTARAGGTGRAVSLVSPDESSLLRDIERLLRKSLPVAALPQYPISASPPRAEQSERPQRSQGRGRSQGSRPDRRSRFERDSRPPQNAQQERHSRPEQQTQTTQPSPEEQRALWDVQPPRRHSHSRHSGSPGRHSGSQGHSSSNGHSGSPGGSKPGATRSWQPRGRRGNSARYTGRPR